MTAEPSQLLDRPLIGFKGFGPVTSGRLEERGITSAGDLLLHRPLRYEDRRKIDSVSAIRAAGTYTVVGRIRGLKSGWARRAPVTGEVVDDTGSIAAVWFNRPYLRRQVQSGEDYVVHGEAREYNSRLQLYNPSLDKLAEGDDPRRVVPVYPSLGDLGPARVRTLMGKLLAQIDLASLPDPLPAEMLERHRLLPLGQALTAIHTPGPEPGALAATARDAPAARRLAFGELLELQLRLQQRRRERAQVETARSYTALRNVGRRLDQLLPFRLTSSQRRVLEEIWTDLGETRPMSRLLQGDVGCGKTAVALGAILAVVESGYQATLMAPTEILAEQHWHGLRRWLPAEVGVELLTGSLDLKAPRRRLAAGRSRLAIGTHALIQEATRFDRLGLVIVDEQHRFGVHQRRDLAEKGDRPDLLVMTATPIPRSLTLALYGDLDLSLIDERPPGRRPVLTETFDATDHRRVVDAVRAEVERGGRVFVVFPSIEAGGERQAPSLEAEGLDWMRRFEPLRCAVLSGRTPAAERATILRRFAAGGTPVLLTTSVIEVGLDVAEAGLLVVDGADWFGLSQLHQLRGRVGRGDRGGLCLALLRQGSEEATERLEIFAATHDGFEIADADLRLRGPGELLGVKQAGVPDLRAASLVHDRDLLEAATVEARRLVQGPTA